MAYITKRDMRDEGVTDPPYSDAWVDERIKLASHLFDLTTGKFFEQRDDFTVYLNGSGTDVLKFVIPPIAADAIDSVTVDGDLVAAADYSVVIPYSARGNIYARLVSTSSVWPKGRDNVVIVGSFGVVDIVDDIAVTPVLVKDAIKRIAMLEMPQIADLEGQRTAAIIEESLRDYQYRLSEQVGRTGLFGDSKIDRIVAMYRSLGIAAV